MKRNTKVYRLTESQIMHIVKEVLNEDENEEYFSEGEMLLASGKDPMEMTQDQRDEINTYLNDTYVGNLIRIVKIGDPSDKQAMDLEGKEGVVKYADGICQLHGTWGGLAVQPWIDEIEVIG